MAAGTVLFVPDTPSFKATISVFHQSNYVNDSTFVVGVGSVLAIQSANPTVCDPSMSYVIPGDPENSLLFQKINGTLAAPPPCGSCMPYQGSCNNEPTIDAAGRDLVRHWIMSLPPMPTGKDLE